MCAAKRHNTPGSKKRRGNNAALWFLGSVLVIFLVFSYMSLNLKNVDYGYEMQALVEKEKTLNEEINCLKAEKASLLNLERVEKIVTGELNYQYPEPDQLIKVYE